MRADNPTIDANELLAHVAWLQRLAARLVESTASAEDLVQDTFVAALRFPPDAARPARPWLAQVLRNLVKNRARGAGRWAARAPRVAAADPALPTAEELLTQHEAQRLVAELVSRLEEPYRSTVLLCYAQGLSAADVARKQDIPAGTVRWRLKRGLDDLRAALDTRYGNDRRAWCLALAPLAAGAGRVGAAFPVGGALLVAAVGAAVALALWLGTFSASPRATDGAVAARQSPAAAVETARAAPGGGPVLGGGPRGGPGRAPSLLAAAAPAAAPAPAADPPGPPDEAIRRAMEVGDAPTRGNPKAPVTIVYFTDFQCFFCARAQTTMAKLAADYPDDVRFVYKTLPLEFHEHAKLAAEAALAAKEQGKFWEMHDRLFQSQSALDPAALELHARAIGLDVPRFRKALDEKRFLDDVEEDARVAKEAGLTGTPAFLINGKRLVGAHQIGGFKSIIDEELARAKGLPVPERAVAKPQPPAGAPGARPAPRRMIERPSEWPPPRLALPDELLGERVRAPFPTGDAPTLGPAGAPVEILYFNDYDCGWCRRGKTLLDGLRQTYGKHIRVVARPLPMEAERSPNGGLVAEAAWAAHAQGKFWELHDKLFSPASTRDRPALERLAAEIGLEVQDFRSALDSGRFRAKVAEDVAMFTQANLRDRPTFVVNGRRADGTVALVQLVEGAIKKAGLKPPPLPEAAPDAAAALTMSLSDPQRFHVETRDEAWASALEKLIAPQLERDLRAVDAKVGGVKLECRTSVCKLRFRPGKASGQAALSLAQQIYGFGPKTSGGPDELLYLPVRGGFEPASPQDSAAKLKSRRSSNLYSLRTGRTRPKADLPLDRLPRQ
jgi:RNA polymerase sigma factor (sigma-70 family)